jgi:mRNA-degrading endonuclease toxin of MazEF toxin-antitoxin module
MGAAHGSEQRGRLPALVVQADPINASRTYGNTIVVALATAEHRVPTHVLVGPAAGSGLAERSFAMCEHIMTVARERLDLYIGAADSETLGRIDRALRRALGLR